MAKRLSAFYVSFEAVPFAKVGGLADVAENPTEIDVERAIRARDRAEKLVSQSLTDPEVDADAASRALARAAARLEAAKKK